MYQEETSYEVISSSPGGSLTMARTFLAKVFSWMFAALMITALTSMVFAATPSLMSLLVTPTGMSLLGWIVMLGPLGFVLAMSLGFNRFSSPVLTLLFLAFAVLMGMSLSFIFLVYTLGSIFITFFVAAGMFGIMAVAGYTTKTDLTRFGSLMFMGLIGIILASVINIFMKSSTFDYIISFIGVLVFTGLTAYDVQKLKRIGAGLEYGAEPVHKLTILGALSLYLDFINLFLYLLRFFGNRR
ncbi:MAG: Bax inhibitor-1/YccA family protein [Bacteroidales bacterium]